MAFSRLSIAHRILSQSIETSTTPESDKTPQQMCQWIIPINSECHHGGSRIPAYCKNHKLHTDSKDWPCQVHWVSGDCFICHPSKAVEVDSSDWWRHCQPAPMFGESVSPEELSRQERAAEFYRQSRAEQQRLEEGHSRVCRERVRKSAHKRKQSDKEWSRRMVGR
ncbi:hypothetical protein C1H76_3868 [Elsinoe australis]|uniref:Uncharacterized protein n=1 Tax=Elsinoe australis TaxID=40998 RepID=A0A4U7B447_9PEZI|nr:hypothetical protein C1H76_3868 [Elsinoe australis]